jgi:hypothetical protein
MAFIVEQSEFKGNKMLVLKRKPEDPYPFQFGVSKAKLMLEAVEHIKEFVRLNDKPKPQPKEENDNDDI